jgi:cyanophycin synthetase
VKVLIDYAHNAAGLETVGDFVERMTHVAPGSPAGLTPWSANVRVAVIATPGDRRDEDQRDLGRVAAKYFDEVFVREDHQLRGRKRGETAAHVMEGLQEGMRGGDSRVGNAEIILDEMDATRKALDRSRPGDVVVLCADYASEVWKELERRRSLAQPGLVPSVRGNGQASTVGGDPDVFEFESSGDAERA